MSTLEAAKQCPPAMQQLQMAFDSLQQLNPDHPVASPTSAKVGLLRKARSTLAHLATSLSHALASSLEGSPAASPMLNRPISAHDQEQTSLHDLIQKAMEQDGVKDVYVVLATAIEYSLRTASCNGA